MTSTPARVRLFFGLPLSEHALQALVAAQQRLKAGAGESARRARWLEPEALHVTLKFLGSVDSKHLEFLNACLVQAAHEVPAFTARLARLTAFPGVGRAKVLVCSVADEQQNTEALARRFEINAKTLGIPAEDRAFHPHITLARLKQPTGIAAWLEEVELEPRDVRFEEVRLYRSWPSSTGSVYSVVAQARLTQGPKPQA